MIIKTFLVLSGVLNLVLLSNFVPSFNQTLDDQTSTTSYATSTVGLPESVPSTSPSVKGLTTRQSQLLFLAEKQFEQDSKIVVPADEYWLSEPLSRKRSLILRKLDDNQALRSKILTAYGDEARFNAVFKTAFYPLAHHAPFLTSEEQIALTEYRGQQQLTPLEFSKNPRLNSNFKPSAVMGVRRIEDTDLASALGERGAFEYGLRYSHLAKTIRQTGIKFTENSFRKTYAIMAKTYVSNQTSSIHTKDLLTQRENLRKLLGSEETTRLLAGLDPRFESLQNIAKNHDLTDANLLYLYEVISQSELEVAEAYSLKDVDPEGSVGLIREATNRKKQALETYFGVDLTKSLLRQVNKASSYRRIHKELI